MVRVLDPTRSNKIVSFNYIVEKTMIINQSKFKRKKIIMMTRRRKYLLKGKKITKLNQY
jgi:hypothetical protein